MGDSERQKLARHVRLEPSDHVLEIGIGWGGLASHAVKNYGCRVTTVTILEEQFRYASERFAREDFAERIEILLTG